jgi:hypothetical protein
MDLREVDVIASESCPVIYCLQSLDYATALMTNKVNISVIVTCATVAWKSLILGMEASLLTRTQQFISVTTVPLSLISMCSPHPTSQS